MYLFYEAPHSTYIMKENPKYTKNESGDYICPHCPKYTAKRMNTMLYHMKKHAGEYPHECKYCDCKFNFYKPLEYHIQSKHPEYVKKEQTPSFKCPCASCSYCAATDRDRKVHFVRKHCKDQLSNLLQKSETKFMCSQCSREFNSRDMFCYHAVDCLNKKEIPLLEEL